MIDHMDWPTLKPSQYLDIGQPGDVRVRGTRIDLCVLVEDYLDGHSPEQMTLNYPTLDLEAVYGAIAYYLGDRNVVDHYVELCRQRASAYHAEIARAPIAPVVARLRAKKSGNKAA